MLGMTKRRQPAQLRFNLSAFGQLPAGLVRTAPGLVAARDFVRQSMTYVRRGISSGRA